MIGLAIPTRLTGRTTFAICALLIFAFGLLSFTATVHKSATFDETIHLVGGFMHKYFNDYRINPEDPGLFGTWGALPHRDSMLAVDIRSPYFREAAVKHDSQWLFSFLALYRDSNNQPDAMLRMSRSMFTYLGIGLGVLTAWWTWRLAGAVAAVTATVLLALDPNLTAHASLVKNDVAIALLLLALGYAIWMLGKDGTLWRLILLAGICGMATNVKFSGVLFGPIAFVLLTARAVMNRPWRLAWLNLNTIGQRLLGVAGVMLAIVIFSWGITWAVYGFRYASLRDGDVLNNDELATFTHLNELRSKLGHPATQVELDAHPNLGFVPRTAFTINRFHLLPHAWTWGFIYTYGSTRVRSAFLLGESSNTGFWYYFPLALLFKTPLATLLAIFGAAGLTIARFASPKLRATERSTQDLWTVLCLLAPPGIYLLVAMAGNLNLGLRHVLGVYPYCFIGVGIVTARLIAQFPKWTKIAVAVLSVALAAESLTSYPNYLPFFNLASGGSRGGVQLLADSNLDWGQDLMLIADWAKQHNDRPLLLSYFGSADPGYYGLHYVNIFAGASITTVMPSDLLRRHSESAYAVVSATSLQNVYADIAEFKILRQKKPIAVLGGSIYVYDWPQADAIDAGMAQQRTIEQLQKLQKAQGGSQ